jgi:hypothetical protein
MIFVNFDKEFFQREYDHLMGRKDRMIEVAQKKGDKLYNLFENASNWILLKIVKKEFDINELGEYFKIACQAIAGYYKLMEVSGKPLKMVIAEKDVELSHEATSYSDVIYITPGIHLSIICRNKECLDVLFNLPDEITFRHDKTKITAPSKNFNILKKIYKNELVSEKEFDDLEKESEKNSSQYKDYYEKLRLPYIQLMRIISNNDKVNFNNFLTNALANVSSYYDTLEDNRNKDIEGWLPLHLISLASLAYDRGFTVDVDNPLLPMFLVKGEVQVSSLRG